jgi:sugar phosphate isomerase/epimerase
VRLGANHIFAPYTDPEEWVAVVKRLGYRAVAAPIDETADDETIAAYRAAAEANDIVIAEVGVWNNPSSDDETVRRAAIELCKARLRLADKLGARCTVNVAGARTKRAGADDLTDEAFDRIVQTVREILDDVRPSHTYYCLETMPWMLPDSVEAYVQLVQAIDRERCGVHCDPVNLCNSPRRYHNSGDLIRSFFRELGPQIRSCHAKDIVLASESTVHLSECRPGTGGLDYHSYVREINRLDPEMPLLMEHLGSDEEYAEAASYILAVEREVTRADA